MSDWELAERDAQIDLAVRLWGRGVPLHAIVARVCAIGARRTPEQVRQWIRRAS